MSAPRFFDENGQHLRRGVKVKRRILSGHWNADEVTGFRWEPERGWAVSTRAMCSLPTQPGRGYNAWVCPDLKVGGATKGGQGG